MQSFNETNQSLPANRFAPSATASYVGNIRTGYTRPSRHGPSKCSHRDATESTRNLRSQCDANPDAAAVRDARRMIGASDAGDSPSSFKVHASKQR